MSRIRSKGTAIELLFFGLLDEAKVPFIAHPKIYGKPDCLIEPNILIFIDGDFWHGWHFYKWKNNLSQEYWRPKIERNMKRDISTARKLRREGYKVIRIWEHTVKKNPGMAIRKIASHIPIAESQK